LPAVFDLTEWYQKENPDVLYAQARGADVFILVELDPPGGEAFDGEKYPLKLVYNWLSHEVTDDKNENWVCIEGSDITYFTKEDVDLAGLSGGTVTLFDCFSVV